MLNNLFVFLTNACGSNCPTDGTNHLCEECYKINKFCEECEVHLKNVIDMSNGLWVIVILGVIFAFGLGYVFGSLDRPIKDNKYL